MLKAIWNHVVSEVRSLTLTKSLQLLFVLLLGMFIGMALWDAWDKNVNRNVFDQPFMKDLPFPNADPDAPNPKFVFPKTN